MDLSTAIKENRKRLGLTQAQLADKMVPPLTREAVTQWENGVSKPRPDTISQLAALFGISISKLMGEDAGLRAGVRMPLMGWTHAGEPMEEIAGDDYAYVPPVVAERHPRGFLLRVRGGCMGRVIPDGSLVCVDPDAEPTNGRVVVMEPEAGESVMRRIWRGRDSALLVADAFEGDYPDVVLRDGDANRLVGVVVWWQAAGES